MKRFKMGLGVVALFLALGTSFANSNHHAKKDVFNWHRYSGPTASPTVTTVIGESDADASAECSTGAFKCMVRLNAQNQEITPAYKRPEQQ